MAVKEMILAHVEKAVLGICVALMGMFLYMSFSLESYKRKPEDFSKAATDARSRVDKNEPQVDDLKSGNLTEAADALGKPTDPKEFFTKYQWRRPFDFGTVFRNEPNILKPGKPVLQDNRGLIGQFLTDSSGKRITKKTKKSDAMFIARGGGRGGRGGLAGAGGLGGMGMGGDDDDDGGAGRMRIGGRGGRGGLAGAGGLGGVGAGGGGQDMGWGRGLFGGNEGMSGREGYGLGDGFEGDIGAGAGHGNATPGPAARQRRIILNEQVIRKRSEKDDKKKKAEKDDEYVEEPLLGMVGRRWVEIVAPFPHANQIREFVKALREPATIVGLRYDMAVVKRRDLQADLTWSEPRDIDLEKQYQVVENAYAFENEPFPQVTIKGLAMNIPLLQTQYKEFLTLPEFNEPEIAIYEKEYLDMTLTAPKYTRKRRESKSTSKLAGAKDAKKSEKYTVSRWQKTAGRRDLGRPKTKDEKGNEIPEDVNVFNNYHQVKTAMIRFFDFTVEPGRRYNYQVAVRTYNPNYLRNDVASGDISTSPYLEGPLSDPSDDIVVEPDVHWYVVKQGALRSENALYRATIEVHYWDDKMGEWLVAQFLHRLGDYIGLSGAKRVVKKVRFDSSTLTWKLTTESSEQDFNAHAILIDTRGGAVRKTSEDGESSLNFRLPRELIAVDRYGDLVRRDESDVSNEVRKAVASNYEQMVKELEASERGSQTAPGAEGDDDRRRREGGGGRAPRGAGGLGGNSAG